MFITEAFLRRLLFVTILLIPAWPALVVLKVGSLPGLDPTRFFIIISTSVWLLLISVSATARSRLANIARRHRKVFFGLLFLFGWKLLSAVIAGGGLSLFISAFRDIVYYLLIFLLALTVLKSEAHLNSVLHTIVLASILISLSANLEVALGENLFVDYATGSGLANTALSQYIYGEGNRVSGTFNNPLALASFISFAFPMLAYVFYRSPSFLWRSLALLALLLSSAAMYHTRSRAGLVVLALLFLLFFMGNVRNWINRIQREWKSAMVILIATCALIFMTLFLSIAITLTQGRTESESGSTEVRAMQMVIGIPKVIAQPWVGYGPGKAADELGLLARTVDNYYLTLAIESGLPELIAFFGLLIAMIIIGWRLFKTKWKGRSLSGVITIAIIGNMLFMSVLSLEQVLPMVFIAFAMLLALDSQLRQTLHNPMR